jgi:hypothetical protein
VIAQLQLHLDKSSELYALARIAIGDAFISTWREKCEVMLLRSFASFNAAASEAALSRLYGGIHYRAAIENGLQQGKCIGNTAYSQFQLHQ